MRESGRDTVSADRVPAPRGQGGSGASRTRSSEGSRAFGIRPNGRRAAARFQLACVRLAWSGPRSGTVWALDGLTDVTPAAREADAASALVEMADAGDVDALALLLRPDPATEATSWSVACYRIGDLVPHSLRDFTDPVEAVTTLADCGDVDHLAAELVASTRDGLCWVALVRTAAQVRFQYFGPHSVLARPGRRARSDTEGEAMDIARAHWAEKVAAWHARQGPVGRIAAGGPSGGAAGGPAGPANVALSWAADAAGGGASASAGGLSAAVSGLSGAPVWDGPFAAHVAETLIELSDAIAVIGDSVERLERTLGAVASRLDGLVPAPSGLGVRTAGPRRIPSYAGIDDTEPSTELEHHWWTPKHRVSRRRPPVDGAAAEPR